MARRSRMEINRAALDEVQLALAEGTFDLARAILRVSEADAPDAAPYGEGLVMRGAAIAWHGKGKVFQVRTDGGTGTVRKPRGSSRLIHGGTQAIVGWGFPAMFLEFGTIHMRARPFLTPAVAEVVGGQAQLILSKAMSRRLRGERDPKSAGISARIAAARTGT